MEKILCLVAFCCLLCTTEAAISGWTTPSITGKDGSAAVATKIDEDTAPGSSTGVTIAATDSASGTIAYAIASQPTAGKLSIDSSTGVLTLAAGNSFDFETEPTYVLTITATVTGSTGTATVTLSIADVNEAPVFASTQYAVTIPDGSAAGTTLTTVKATDQDSGDTIAYSISSGNTATMFTIGGTSGIITVATSKTLAAATVGGYQLEVLATDDDTPAKIGTATVWVAVKTCSSDSVMLISSMITLLVALVASLQ